MDDSRAYELILDMLNERMDKFEEKMEKNHEDYMAKFDGLYSLRWKFSGVILTLGFLFALVYKAAELYVQHVR